MILEMILATILATALAVAAASLALWAEARRRALVSRTRIANALVAELPDSHISWGPEGEETVSPGLAPLLGREEITLAGLAELFSPDDAAHFIGRAEALQKRGERFDLTLDLAAPQPGHPHTLRLLGQRSRHTPVDVVWVRDISRFAAQQADLADRLAAAEIDRDDLRTALDLLATAIWSRRGAGPERHRSNRAFHHLFGKAPTGATAEMIDALAAKAIETGETQTERCHVVVDGDRRLFAASVIPDLDGGVVGQAIDITRTEALDNELARHIAAHSDVLETLTVAIAIYDPDTTLAFHNTAYARLWDADPQWLNTKPTLGEELEQLRARRRLPEYADFRAWRDAEMDLFTSLIGPREDLIHLPDGRALRARVSPHPFGGLLFTYEDVTDKLALEAEFNTLIEVQRQSLDNLYEGIALIGADGKLKLCNAAYKKIWDFTDDDVANEPHVSELIDKTELRFADNVAWAERRRAAVALATSREPQTGLMELQDGSVLQHSSVPLPDGMTLRTFLDISDQLKVEQALRERAEALEAADSLKTHFIANVSYELRTPLSSIMGFTEILQQGSLGPVNEAQADYFQSILASGQELLDLINDILDLATIEAGYMEIHPQDFDIAGLMESVHALVRERARMKDLTLHVDCKADIGSMRGDESRLKQVLFNLAANAINFTPAEGEVRLSASRDGDDVLFTVTDTGIGIAQDQVAQVFDMFERGGDPMVRQSNSGPGLGLSIVQSFVHLHDGEVEILSEQQKGTTVRARIPAAGPDLTNRPAAGSA